MILSLKAIFIAACIAFIGGNISGGLLIAKVYNFRAMNAQINALKADKARYVKAIDASKTIDAEAAEVDLSNLEIDAAINRIIDKEIDARIASGLLPDPSKVNPKPPAEPEKVVCDVPKPDHDPVVLSPELLRAIGRLR